MGFPPSYEPASYVAKLMTVEVGSRIEEDEATELGPSAVVSGVVTRARPEPLK